MPPRKSTAAKIEKTSNEKRRGQPQQERSRRTRESILRSAAACFDEEGFEGTTTAKIAKRAGVGISPVYSYFEDKRSILLEILDDALELMVEDALLVLDPKEWTARNFRSRLTSLLRESIETRRVSPRLMRVMWQRIFEGDMDFQHMAQRHEDRVVAALQKLLEKLRRDGALRVPASKATSFILYAGADWIIMRLLIEEAPVTAKQAADTVADMFTAYLIGTD